MSKVFPFAREFVCHLRWPRLFRPTSLYLETLNSQPPTTNASFHLFVLLHLLMLLLSWFLFGDDVADLKVPIRDFRLNYFREHTKTKFVWFSHDRLGAYPQSRPGSACFFARSTHFLQNVIAQRAPPKWGAVRDKKVSFAFYISSGGGKSWNSSCGFPRTSF